MRYNIRCMPHLETKTKTLTKNHHTLKTRKKKRSSSRAVRNLFLGLTKGLLTGIFTLATIVALVLAVYTLIHNLVAPDVEKFLSTPPKESSKLYASDGSLLYELYNSEKRTNLTKEDISPNFLHAIVAAEDKDFYLHPGVSASSIIRATLQNILTPEQISGGSTITQQLVKNSILTPEKSIYRKIAEAIWAIELEKHLSKDDILTLYTNTISFGRNSAGVEAASMSYFGKPAKNLSITEATYLAALPKAPSLLSPGGPNREALVERASYILDNMKDLGYLSEEDYTKAKSETISFIVQDNSLKAPYFTLWLRGELIKQFSTEQVFSGGLRVYTTLDPKLQSLAESKVLEFATKNTKAYRASNAALVAINPRNGSIQALVGGKNYFGSSEPAGCSSGKDCLFDPNANVATALRQVGSSFKPYVYVTAFGPDFKFTPATIISDRSKNFSAPGLPAYIPHNYTGAQYGNVPIRKALAGSLNIAAVNTLSQIGPDAVITNLRALGVTAPLKGCGLALALGACEMSLLEHTADFATLANMGEYNPVTGIDRIVGQGGRLILQNSPENKQVLNPQAVYELVSIMTDNNARSYIFGKNNPLTLTDRPVAAKTGTTQNWKDGFTLGFTPSLAVGVWTGNNNGTVMRQGADGVVTAAPLWHAFMEAALADTPAETFVEPEGITHLRVNPSTGKVNKTKTGGTEEVFASYAIPYDEFKLPARLKPKILQFTKKPSYKDLLANAEEETIVLDPWQNETVLKTPFDVKIYTGTSTEETSVELKLDNKVIAVLSEAPFLFTVTDKLVNGPHIITATATHFGILESTDTVKFKTFFNPPPLAPRGK